MRCGPPAGAPLLPLQRNAQPSSPLYARARLTRARRTQLLLVLFIIVQGPKGEGMINSMNGAQGRKAAAPVRSPDARVGLAESRMFGNFSETKNFVTIGTWGLAGAFLLLSAVTALKQ